jgi:hypothetical protein
MAGFAIAYNDSTSLYEVHAAGCRHTTMNARLEVMVTVEAPTGAEAAAQFEAGNEDCLTKLGPCARGR